jgi:hypothetical protein
VNLRKLAKGQPCQIRLPCCNHNPETTVLAHYSLAGISGAGIKSPDWIASWSCSDCHDAVDGRVSLKGHDQKIIRLAHAEGVFRTQYEVLKIKRYNGE